ncbi:glycosyl hydrolase 53 family protein [Microbacterium sp. cf332]|uniref:glycoside hydrolase family 53 protein n=1 Tax=Microbacterium sp. cf332 TaxID=1761804 RepID=UPI00088FE8B4|nr:glycosyl hydrolase 53 family protein [Microbacterium sp. cf332]SDQ19628.1 arabinogalactan endo-1,4-beta-galactosidase [Microbacterium sp. cf332]
MTTTPLPVRGADVSMTAEIEALGARFSDAVGTRDLFAILADHGVNLARLRVWVDPTDAEGRPYQGGTNDLDTTLRLAERARAAGLGLMVDLHYSDFWADPKKQSLPRSWRHLDMRGVCDAVAAHTSDVVDAVRGAAGSPEWVQVGNETTNGMLWPFGRTPKYDLESRTFAAVPVEEARAQYDRLATLLQAGSAAVRAAAPGSRIVLHLDAGGAADLYRRWFDEITARGVDFDAVGLSYYPLWHGSLDDLRANLHAIVKRFDRDVIVVETAYAHRPDNPAGMSMFDAASPAAVYPPSVVGQARYLDDLAAVVRGVPGGRGVGIVYWEPAWLPVAGTSWASDAGMAYGDDIAEPGNGWANQTLFDERGRALASLTALGAASGRCGLTRGEES